MPIRDLRDKRCFITGAGSGIGRATAIAAAARGAELFLTDIDEKALERVVAEIRRAGGRVAAHEAFDIASFEAVQAFASKTHASHGSMDVLMNVAGISTWGTIDELSHTHWRRLVEVNLMGPIHVLESFVPAMMKAGRGGHIVNVSSAAGLFGLPWHAAYSATKFGLRGISEVLRFDLARHGIGVSLVCPGGVDTGLVRTVDVVGIDRESPEFKKLQAHFQKRAASPESAAEAILRGIEQNRYMVYTSLDIRVGHWFQRRFELPYAIVMRLLNDRLHALKSLPTKREGTASAASERVRR